MNEPLFARRIAIALFVVVGVSLLAFLWLILSGDRTGDLESAGADSFSRSAVGHHMFVAWLRRLQVPVTVSRWESARRAGESAVLVLAEPRRSLGLLDLKSAIASRLEDADRTLLVLPKWRWKADRRDAERIEAASLLSTSQVGDVLRSAGIEGHVLRAASPDWRDSGDPRPDLRRAQLVESPDLTPLVSAREGVLLGEVEGAKGRLLVLTDPDVIANHGLGRGDNALIAWRAIETLTDDDRPVVVDETIHGYERRPHLWAEVTRFPLVLAFVHLLFVVGLVLWAGMGRFGAPLPPEEGLAAGKEILVENTASLLFYGGHSARVLDQYFATARRAAARALRAPPQLRRDELIAWIGARARARGVRVDFPSLAEEVRSLRRADRPEAKRILAVARRIHEFREEIEDGPREHS